MQGVGVGKLLHPWEDRAEPASLQRMTALEKPGEPFREVPKEVPKF